MTDATPQPVTAGETGLESPREQSILGAADAFKVALGQAPERKRDESGRFAAAQPAAEQEQIETPDEAEEVEAGAESHEEQDEGDEAPEEGQPEAAELPTSWPADKAELWETLEPDAQAFIRQRDAQMTSAVNAKFQEAANLRQAHEAEINEATVNRQRYAEAVDQVLSLVVPQPPPRSMLDINSNDYDPDAYHYRKAVHEDTIAYLNQHAAQRQQIAAQETMQRFNAINAATRDNFIQLVPDAADQAKAPAVFQGLMEYAVSQGAPIDLFQTPTTALEWAVLWKAKEYDRIQGAKQRVGEKPAPPQRKPSPAVRPGVTTPRSAREAAGMKQDMDRLNETGSIEAGAAIWKRAMKGAR